MLISLVWTSLCLRLYLTRVNIIVLMLISLVWTSSQPLDSGSQHLDSGFQPFGFRIPYQSGFRIPNHCGFRIPTAKICWIPDSGFSYMGRIIVLMLISLVWTSLCLCWSHSCEHPCEHPYAYLTHVNILVLTLISHSCEPASLCLRLRRTCEPPFGEMS